MILTLSYRMAGAIRSAPDVEAELRAVVEREPWDGHLIGKLYHYSENRRGLVWARVGADETVDRFNVLPLYRAIGDALSSAHVNDWYIELRMPKEPPASA